MVFMKVLVNALKSIKHQVFIKLVLIQSHEWILAVMMKHVYVSKFEILDDHRAGKNHCDPHRQVKKAWWDDARI